MVKCLPEFEYFTVFLNNKNIIFKIKRSKVTDYALMLQVRHILCEKPERAFSAIRQLRRGLRFNEVAKTHSTDKAKKGVGAIC